MKIHKKYLTSVFAIALIGCTSYVEDINVDPNKIITDNAQSINFFQTGLLANQYFQTTNNTRNTMLWLGQANGSDRQYIPLNNWNNNLATDSDSAW